MRATSRRRTTPNDGWPGPRSGVTPLLTPMRRSWSRCGAAPHLPSPRRPSFHLRRSSRRRPRLRRRRWLRRRRVVAPPVAVVPRCVEPCRVVAMESPWNRCRAAARRRRRMPRRRRIRRRRLGKPKLPWGGAAMAVRADGGGALMPALTMISPNCSGVLSRPKVLIGSSKAWPA